MTLEESHVGRPHQQARYQGTGIVSGTSVVVVVDKTRVDMIGAMLHFVVEGFRLMRAGSPSAWAVVCPLSA